MATGAEVATVDKLRTAGTTLLSNLSLFMNASRGASFHYKNWTDREVSNIVPSLEKTCSDANFEPFGALSLNFHLMLHQITGKILTHAANTPTQSVRVST